MKPISRRTFLTGAAGVAAATLFGGYEANQHPNVLHSLGLTSSPDAATQDSHAHVESGVLKSAHMREPVAWTYSMPATAPVATLFCMHGKGGDHAQPFTSLRLPDFAAIANLPLAIAGVDGGDHNYWHARTDGSNAMEMFISEFIPLIESRVQTTKRALYGWSMGGYGALLAAATHKNMFSAVAAMSPALWTKSSDAAPGAFDSAADFHQNDVFFKRDDLSSLPVFVACGTHDPFLKADKQFVSGLHNVQGHFTDGYHDDAFWRSQTGAALQFINAAVTA